MIIIYPVKALRFQPLKFTLQTSFTLIFSNKPATNYSMKVDPKLLEILVCPLTKGALRYDAKNNELISDQAKLAYPIRDGIPIMLVDEARPLDK